MPPYDTASKGGAFEDKAAQWIASHCLLDGISGLLLAVSGGADSVALAAVLHRLVAAGRLNVRLVVGHVNHTLRGDASNGDEAFVRAMAERLSLPCVCRRVDVRGSAQKQKLSIETAARSLRLDALAALANESNCQAVATGHQTDDQAETVVHRLMRGTALSGLCGIRPMTVLNGRRFVRPLLTVRRAEIEAYLRDCGWVWRDDATNRSYAFTRNRIRHRLLPALHKQSPDVAARLRRLAECGHWARLRVESTADLVKPVDRSEHTLSYSRSEFIRQSPWVQVELIGRAICALGGGLRDVTSRHYRELMAKAARADSAKITWPGRLAVSVEADRLTFSAPIERLSVFPSEPVAVSIGTVADFGPYTIRINYVDIKGKDFFDYLANKPPCTEWLDAERIEGPLVARQIRPGDRFWPLGLGHEKKVARFLQDSQILKPQRQSVFVLADTKKIIYLAPLRLDERAKVSKRTKKILKINIFYRDKDA